jgi:hypothetical protein
MPLEQEISDSRHLLETHLPQSVVRERTTQETRTFSVAPDYLFNLIWDLVRLLQFRWIGPMSLDPAVVRNGNKEIHWAALEASLKNAQHLAAQLLPVVLQKVDEELTLPARLEYRGRHALDATSRSTCPLFVLVDFDLSADAFAFDDH